jgi:DNA-binding transcriptional ArsR family regulator
MSKVRRLTTPRLEPALEIRVSEVAEAILGLYQSGWLVDPGVMELGRDWFGDIRTSLSTSLLRLIAAARESTQVEGALHDLVAMTVDDGGGMGNFLDRLRAQRSLPHDRAPAPKLLAQLLDRWNVEAFAPRWPEIRPILERDVEAKRRLAASVSFAEVVEEATKGGEYVPEVGVERVVLLPTYVHRPWVMQARLGRAAVITYPVADESVARTTEEAQRGRILRLTKALGDETRLRALRHLAVNSCSLQELADQVGVRKSTMHHHLAVLRAAGLVRMRLGEKRYSLRSLPLAQASPLLRDYLGAEDRRR